MRPFDIAWFGQANFGRDGAMFESLVGFVAQLSVVLWSLVVLTAVIRFIGVRIYRRGAAHTAHVENGAAHSALVKNGAVRTAPVESGAARTAYAASVAVSTTAGEIDQVQPVAGQLADAGLVRRIPAFAGDSRRA